MALQELFARAAQLCHVEEVATSRWASAHGWDHTTATGPSALTTVTLTNTAQHCFLNGMDFNPTHTTFQPPWQFHSSLLSLPKGLPVYERIQAGFAFQWNKLTELCCGLYHPPVSSMKPAVLKAERRLIKHTIFRTSHPNQPKDYTCPQYSLSACCQIFHCGVVHQPIVSLGRTPHLVSSAVGDSLLKAHRAQLITQLKVSKILFKVYYFPVHRETAVPTEEVFPTTVSMQFKLPAASALSLPCKGKKIYITLLSKILLCRDQILLPNCSCKDHFISCIHWHHHTSEYMPSMNATIVQCQQQVNQRTKKVTSDKVQRRFRLATRNYFFCTRVARHCHRLIRVAVESVFFFTCLNTLKCLLQFLRKGYWPSFCLFPGHTRGNLRTYIGKVHPSYQTYRQDLTTICETEESTPENNYLLKKSFYGIRK